MPQGWIVPAAVDTDFLTGGFSGVRCRLTVINLLHVRHFLWFYKLRHTKSRMLKPSTLSGITGMVWGCAS